MTQSPRLYTERSLLDVQKRVGLANLILPARVLCPVRLCSPVSAVTAGSSHRAILYPRRQALSVRLSPSSSGLPVHSSPSSPASTLLPSFLYKCLQYFSS